MKPTTEIAVFGGGCFWCTEAVFKELRGVVSVMPGYAGGHAERADHHAKRGGTVSGTTYEEVSAGKTGHAEVIRIEYNSAQISYETLLTVFFATHDPTTLNRQGADVGTQYRSVILYTSEAQKIAAVKFITELNASSRDGKPGSRSSTSRHRRANDVVSRTFTTGNPIVTEVKPLEHFYEAEAYHRDYYAKNQDQQYCKVVIDPKLKKVKEKFAALIKKESH